MDPIMRILRPETVESDEVVRLRYLVRDLSGNILKMRGELLNNYIAYHGRQMTEQERQQYVLWIQEARFQLQQAKAQLKNALYRPHVNRAAVVNIVRNIHM